MWECVNMGGCVGIRESMANEGVVGEGILYALTA